MSDYQNTTQAPSNGELVSDDIFEALAQEPQPAPDSDNGSNSELEQLIGTLQDLDVPGPPALPTLTLEDVAAAAEAPALLDAAMGDGGTLRCPKCGSSNPRGNRYCGMCAGALAGSSARAGALGTGKVAPLPGQPTPQPAKIVVVGATPFRLSLRMVELVLLSALTAVLTYQLQDWWQPAMLKASHWLR